MIITDYRQFLKRVLNLRYLLNILLYSYINKYATNSYSQEGEDRILYSIFGGKINGYYVDIGAHHPQRFSNTNLFYNMGWNGINIDANKEAIGLFKKYRERDKNIFCGVGIKEGISTYLIFDEPAINTFDNQNANDKVQNTRYKIIEKRKVKILPLSKILDKNIDKNRKIDFMTVDVEGKDLDVLKSNNWKKYSPAYVLTEIYGGHTFSEVLIDPVSNFLRKKGYIPIAKSLNTVIYKKTT